MNPRFLPVLALLALTSLAACSKREADVGGAAPPTDPASALGTGSAPAPASARDLAVTVELSLTTDHVDDAVTTLRDEVAREGGYLGRANVIGEGDDRSADLEAHVPKPELGKLRPVASGLGDVTSDVETVEDVTESRADVKARLHAAQVEEARLLDLMKEHTGKLSEILESEKELARVRETIERIQAEERTVDGRVAYATVHVHLRARAVAAWRTPGKSIAQAGRAGVHAAAALAVGVGMAVAALGPTLVPIALLVFAIVTLVRRRAQKRAELALR